MNTPSKTKSKTEIGYSGANTRFGQIRADEFQNELKGKQGIRKIQGNA